MQFNLESPGVAMLWTVSRVGKAYMSESNIMSHIDCFKIHKAYMSESNIMSHIDCFKIHTVQLHLTDIDEWILMLHFLVQKHFKNIFVFITNGIFRLRDKPLVEALFLLNTDTLIFDAWCNDYLLLERLCCQQNWFERVVVLDYQQTITRSLSIMQLNTRAMLGFIEVNWVKKRRLPKELLMMLRTFLYN
jgi:hypothetical protein